MDFSVISAGSTSSGLVVVLSRSSGLAIRALGYIYHTEENQTRAALAFALH